MIFANLNQFKNVDHALFQARIWREYGNTFNGCMTSTGVDAMWVYTVLRMDKQQCIERAKIALEAARKFNEQS